MSTFELIIGNKNYSSWSLRPWIAMKTMQVPFSETLVKLNFDNGNIDLLKHSPSQKVPVLKHGELTVWDSLAILEYVAELSPEKAFWPTDPSKRAIARSISCQMHSGFADLRNECPMNMRRKPSDLEISDEAKRDVSQIEALWRSALDASGGPFLFGEFSIADAMFAPVVNRFLIFELTKDATALSYCNNMTALPAWQEWASAAANEEWVLDYAEI